MYLGTCTHAYNTSQVFQEQQRTIYNHFNSRILLLLPMPNRKKTKQFGTGRKNSKRSTQRFVYAVSLKPDSCAPLHLTIFNVIDVCSCVYERSVSVCEHVFTDCRKMCIYVKRINSHMVARAGLTVT